MANSEHCQFEMRRIEQRVAEGSMAGVLEVRMADGNEGAHRASALLAADTRPRMDYGGDPGEVLAFLNEHTALAVGAVTVSSSSNADADAAWRAVRRFGLDFQPRLLNFVRGPSPAKVGYTIPPELWYGGFAGMYKGLIDSQHVLSLAVTAFPFSTAVRTRVVGNAEAMDDRELYAVYRGFAAEWLDKEGLEPLGLHLFYWRGHSHMALTYAFPAELAAKNEEDRQRKKGRTTFERRYVLTLPSAGQALRRPDAPYDASASSFDVGEASFTFTVDLPKDNRQENLQTFHAIATQIEPIVESVSYKPSRALGWFWLGPMLLAHLIVIGLGFGVWGMLMPDPKRVLFLPAMALLGFAAGHLLLMALWRECQFVYRQVPTMVDLWRDRLEPERDFTQRVLSDVLVVLKGLRDTALAVFGDPWAPTLVWAAVAFGVSSPWYWLAAGAVLALRGVWVSLRRLGVARAVRRLGQRRLASPRFPDLRALADLSPSLPALLIRLEIENITALRVAWGGVALSLLITAAVGAAG